MTLFNYTKPKMVVADEGKQIRDINDIYVPEHYDEEGHLIPAHYPYYATTVFVPDDFTEEMMYELYIEEAINNVQNND